MNFVCGLIIGFFTGAVIGIFAAAAVQVSIEKTAIKDGYIKLEGRFFSIKETEVKE